MFFLKKVWMNSEFQRNLEIFLPEPAGVTGVWCVLLRGLAVINSHLQPVCVRLSLCDQSVWAAGVCWPNVILLLVLFKQHLGKTQELQRRTVPSNHPSLTHSLLPEIIIHHFPFGLRHANISPLPFLLPTAETYHPLVENPASDWTLQNAQLSTLVPSGVEPSCCWLKYVH